MSGGRRRKARWMEFLPDEIQFSSREGSLPSARFT